MKLKNIRLIIMSIFIFAVLPVISVYAQLQENNETAKISPTITSLKSALKIAFKNNHEYKIAQLNKETADKSVNAIWGKLFPAIQSTGNVGALDGDSGPNSLTSGTNYSIDIAQLNFQLNPGVFYNELNVSKKQYTIATEDLRRISHDIEFRVIKEYFDIILKDEIVNLYKYSIKLLKKNLSDVQEKFKAGSIPKYDVLQAQVKLQAEQDKFIFAENDALISLENFNTILGVKTAFYTADPETLKNEDYIIPSTNRLKIMKNMIEIALKNRPEIIQIEMKKEIANSKRWYYSSRYIWPTFNLGASYGYSYYENNHSSGKSYSPWSQDWVVNFGATYRWGDFIPVSESSTRSRIEKLKIKEAEESLLKLKDDISVSVRKSYYTLTTATRTIDTGKENIKTAQEGLRIAWESYRAGLIQNYEYIDAKVLLVDAKTRYINSIVSYYTNLAELKKFTGIKDGKVLIQELNKK